MSYPRVLPVGESAFTVEFGDRVDAELNRRVHALDRLLLAEQAAEQATEPVLGSIVETVPTYRSLLVIYNPDAGNAPTLQAHLLAKAEAILARDETLAAAQHAPRTVEIPVHYGGDWGPDLADVAAHCRLSPAAVIARHTSARYQVAMLGFAPGFAYLLGLPPALATPRLATPRREVPAGSVGIAGPQTGVYALSTPGGWRIIGRTPLALFDPTRAQPFSLQAGDYVRFRHVDGG